MASPRPTTTSKPSTSKSAFSKRAAHKAVTLRIERAKFIRAVAERKSTPEFEEKAKELVRQLRAAKNAPFLAQYRTPKVA